MGLHIFTVAVWEVTGFHKKIIRDYEVEGYGDSPAEVYKNLEDQLSWERRDSDGKLLYYAEVVDTRWSSSRMKAMSKLKGFSSTLQQFDSNELPTDQVPF